MILSGFFNFVFGWRTFMASVSWAFSIPGNRKRVDEDLPPAIVDPNDNTWKGKPSDYIKQTAGYYQPTAFNPVSLLCTRSASSILMWRFLQSQWTNIPGPGYGYGYA